MIATTTGIAPFRSMIRSVLATGVSSGSPGGKRAHRFVVVHGARSVEDLPFFREFEDLARRCEQVSYVPAVTNAAASGMTPWRGRRGRVDAVARDLLGSSIESRELRVYACGNAGMVANVRESFGRLGLDVRHEKFF
jgi:ferredoxin-NADP reductase